MKRFLVITLVLIFAMIMAAVPANADSDRAKIVVDFPSELPKTGDEFEVLISISQNPGFSAIQFLLQYDKNVLACEKIFLDDILAGTISSTNPNGADGAVVAAATLNSVVKNGTLATCVFVAKTDVEKFDFRIKDVTLCDEERNDIEYEVVGVAAEEENPPTNRDENDIKEENTADLSNTETGDNDFADNKENGVAESTEDNDFKPSDEDSATESIFPDVKGHWAEEFIGEAVELELFKGNADGTFHPDSNVTRAQFVTVLWRMAGMPETSEEYPFKDIEDQIPEFKSAIAWAYANGYANGISETEFDPNGTLTREAGMKILHYYSGGQSGMELQLQSIYNSAFEDSSLISQWAKKSVYWGIYNKMIAGTSETTLSPQGTATRAQLAKILVNYLDIYSRK